MSQRQGGWRSARHVAPLPQTPRAIAAQTHQPRAAGPAIAARIRRVAASVADQRWSVSFVAILAYTASAVTYRVPLVAPAVVGALLGLVLEKERIVFPTFMALFFMFVAWASLSYSGSFAPEWTSDEIVVLLKLSVIAFAIANVIRNGWRARIFVIFFLACFGAFPVRGTLLNYFVIGYTRFGRALWNFIYANSNDLAALTFFPLSMCVALALTEKKGWVRYAALAGCGVLPLMILLTQSRAALIGLVVSILLFFILHSHGKRLRTLLTALALSVLTLPFVPSSAWQRFAGLSQVTSSTTIQYADPEGSAEARSLVWRVARTIIADHPITGIGLGAYSVAHNRYSAGMPISNSAKGFRDTHSTYLNIAAEMGLVGLGIFIAMILVALIEAEVTRRRAKHIPRSQWILALQLGLIAFLVAGIFGSFSKLAFLYVQLAFLWATTNLTRQELAASAAPVAGAVGSVRRQRGGWR